MDRKFIFNQWLESQKRKAQPGHRAHKKTFIGERAYPHIDGPLHYPRAGCDVAQAAWLEETIMDTNKLAAHGFLPFIRNSQRNRKFREPPNDYAYTAVRGGRDQKRFPYIKSRPIMYASHRDACIFSYYSYALQQLYEQELAKRSLTGNIIAYRSIDGKNNVDFAKEAFDAMLNRPEYDCLMLDVKNFFDTISHPKLEAGWGDLLQGGFDENPDHKIILARITRYNYLDFSEAIQTLKLNKVPYLPREYGCRKLCTLANYNHYLKRSVKTNQTGVGIPQGSPISGVLANLYLLNFDTTMRDLVATQNGGVYQRYSDDILILCPIGKAKSIHDRLQHALGSECLELGRNKTEAFRKQQRNPRLENITHLIELNGNRVRHEAQYLGLHFDGKAISLRPGTLSKHLRSRRRPDYFKGAYRKTHSAKIARQVNKIRQLAKKINQSPIL